MATSLTRSPRPPLQPPLRRACKLYRRQFGPRGENHYANSIARASFVWSAGALAWSAMHRRVQTSPPLGNSRAPGLPSLHSECQAHDLVRPANRAKIFRCTLGSSLELREPAIRNILVSLALCHQLVQSPASSSEVLPCNC